MIFNFFLLIMLFILACSQQPDISDVAIVNDATLSLKTLEEHLENNPLLIKEDAVAFWIEEELLYQEGKKLGLHKNKKTKGTIKRFLRSLVIKEVISSHAGGGLITINESEIRNYYDKNKKTLKHQPRAVLADLYSTQNTSVAKKIKKHLLYKEDSSFLNEHRLFSGTIKEGASIEGINNVIFNNDKNRNIIGPTKVGTSFFLIKILERFTSKTPPGIDVVYDEIYQRIFNKKKNDKRTFLIDSLRGHSYVHINKVISP